MNTRKHNPNGFISLKPLLYKPEYEAHRDAQEIRKAFVTLALAVAFAACVVGIGAGLARAF